MEQRGRVDEAEVVTRTVVRLGLPHPARRAPQVSFQQSGDGSSWVWVHGGGGLMEAQF